MTIPTEAILTFFGVVFTALLGWLGIHTKVKGDKAIADRPDWQGFTDSMQDWMKDRLSEQNKKIERLEQDLSSVRAEVDGLRTKYTASLRSLRKIVEKSPHHRDDIEASIADEV